MNTLVRDEIKKLVLAVINGQAGQSLQIVRICLFAEVVLMPVWAQLKPITEQVIISARDTGTPECEENKTMVPLTNSTRIALSGSIGVIPFPTM